MPQTLRILALCACLAVPAGAVTIPTDLVLHSATAGASIHPIGGSLVSVSRNPLTPTSSVGVSTGAPLSPLRGVSGASESRQGFPGIRANTEYLFVAETQRFALTPTGGNASATIDSSMQIVLADDDVELDLSVSFVNVAAGTPLSPFASGTADITVRNLTTGQTLASITGATSSVPTIFVPNVGAAGDTLEIVAFLTSDFDAPLASPIVDGLRVEALATFTGAFVDPDPDPDPDPASEGPLGLLAVASCLLVMHRAARRPAR